LIHHYGKRDEKNLLDRLRGDNHLQDKRGLAELYQRFPEASQQAFKDATEQLKKALSLLSESGLPLSPLNKDMFIKILVKVFRHPNRLLNLRDR